MTSRIAGIGLSAALLASTGAPARARAESKGEAATPGAAWEKARDAYRRGDFRTYIESISPQAHDECICDVAYLVGMALGAGMLGSDRDLEELNGILRRYGVSEIRPGAPPDAGGEAKPGLRGRKAIHLIADKVGLYGETMSFLRRHRVGPALPASMSVDLAGVKVDGDGATASLGAHGEMAFDRVGDSWVLHPRPVCLDDIFRDEKG